MLVSISTGAVRHSVETKLEEIHFIEKEFGGLVDGVEICIMEPEEFLSLQLDEKAVSFLKSLPYNSVHAPLKGMGYGKNEKAEKIFAKMREINKKVGLHHATFHPNHVHNFRALKTLGLGVCIENLSNGKKRRGWQKPNEFKKFFEKNPFFGFCFDVNHGMANGIEPKKFVSTLGEKITCIHLNATESAGHASHNLVIDSSRKAQQKILPVFGLKKPVIIEPDLEKEKVHLIKKEIEFARKMFKS